jgi:hypothetical protein
VCGQALVASLPFAKINVLHWHLTDSQSFPLETPSAPRLWRAAWSPAERYTADDVAALVEFARRRAVRVIPELDVPAHAASWCVGYPGLCPRAADGTLCEEPLRPFGLPGSAAGADVEAAVRGVLADAAALFPERLLHLGGDEVGPAAPAAPSPARGPIRTDADASSGAGRHALLGGGPRSECEPARRGARRARRARRGAAARARARARRRAARGGVGSLPPFVLIGHVSSILPY